MDKYICFLVTLVSGWLFIPTIFYSFFVILSFFKKPQGIKLIIPLLSAMIVAATIAFLLIISPWKLMDLLHIKYVGSKLPVWGFMIGIMSSSLILNKTNKWIKAMKMAQNSKLN